MNLLGHLRHLRWLPRALLAVLALTIAQTSLIPCAMAGGSSSAPMSEHCVYCPPDMPGMSGLSKLSGADATATVVTGSGCLYPHSPNVDVFAASAQHLAALLNSPLLQPTPFDLNDLRQTRDYRPAFYSTPAPTRPLNLTHCVQLK